MNFKIQILAGNQLKVCVGGVAFEISSTLGFLVTVLFESTSISVTVLVFEIDSQTENRTMHCKAIPKLGLLGALKQFLLNQLLL